jgi:hypothetical protein
MIRSKTFYLPAAQSGKTETSIPKTSVPQKYITSVIIMILRIFNKTPVFTMSITLIRLVPKMIAFGGVATGSIKAIDAAKVAGIISKSGLS